MQNTTLRFAWNLFWISAAFLAVLIGIGGCASGFQIDYMPRQDEAVELVTRHYGMSPASAPYIEWVRGERLNCANGVGWYSDDGQCVEGETRLATPIAPSHMLLALWPGVTWARTGLAHELCHMRQLGLTGDGDAEHRSVCFRDAGHLDPGRVGSNGGLSLEAETLLTSSGFVVVDATLE